MKKLFAVFTVALLFTVLVACDEEKSSNANLSALTVSDGSFTFDSATTNYQVQVSSSPVGVTPTVADSGASLRIRAVHSAPLDWTSIDSGSTTTVDLITSGYYRFDYSGNVVDIEVTAEDGTQKVYTVFIKSGPF